MLISIIISRIQLFPGSDKPIMQFFLLINVKKPTLLMMNDEGPSICSMSVLHLTINIEIEIPDQMV